MRKFLMLKTDLNDITTNPTKRNPVPQDYIKSTVSCSNKKELIYYELSQFLDFNSFLLFFFFFPNINITILVCK